MNILLNIYIWTDVNVKDTNGQTPLHKATLRGHDDIVALLKAGMNHLDTDEENDRNVPEGEKWKKVESGSF